MIQKTRYPNGMSLVESGNAPCGAKDIGQCIQCTEGHATECHYGMTCLEADCEHYRTDIRLLIAQGAFEPDQQSGCCTLGGCIFG